jgi:hypothetical protein
MKRDKKPLAAFRKNFGGCQPIRRKGAFGVLNLLVFFAAKNVKIQYNNQGRV